METSDNDYEIVRLMELWANGAAIHNAKALIGNLRVYSDAIAQAQHSSNPGLPPGVEYWIACRRSVYLSMLDYMQHGDYLRATRSHPLPDWPGDGVVWKPDEMSNEKNETALLKIITSNESATLSQLSWHARRAEDDVRQTLRRIFGFR